MPLLAVVVFWLALLFISFGLFVRPNVTVVVSLFASALAVCCAIFLILEMYQPYSGLIHVSDAPLRAALAQIGL
jgi:nitric oxide reductase large subunit